MTINDILCNFPPNVKITENTFDDRDPKHIYKIFGKQAKLLNNSLKTKLIGKTVWSLFGQWWNYIDFSKIENKAQRKKALRRLKIIAINDDEIEVKYIKDNETFSLYEYDGNYVSGSGADLTFVFV